MESQTRSRRLVAFAATAIATLLVLATVLISTSSSNASTATESLNATYSRGVLRVGIPYRAANPGAGRLTLEVLDADDRVVGTSTYNVTAAYGKGYWRQQLTLAKPLELDELVWHRLRYRFVYTSQGAPIEGTESISQILRMPVLRIVGQQSYLRGAQAAVRVIVMDSKNEPITGPSSVRIDLMDAGKARTIFAGKLNQRGTTEAQFQLPPDLCGAHALRYVAETPLGSNSFTQQIQIQDKASILLTTEKPIYQPGQTIHMRALALDRAGHLPTANRAFTFEVEDSRGNKVFNKATRTDRFGVASAEFGLADEVNLGTYHLRALMHEGDANARNTAEIALTVDRYVLPKFKVAVDFEDQGSGAKHGYRPGDRVQGIVRANYFFGKPVSRGEVIVKATGMDVAQFEAGSAKGDTDIDGAYRFDFRLPAYFAGAQLHNGTARILVEATVKDTAGHAETRGEPITVSKSPLVLMAVPEGGKLAPGLENLIFILASYADGQPARAAIRVQTGGATQNASTDENGVAEIRLTPGRAGEKLHVEASDKEGNHAATELALETRDDAEQVLLRTDRAVYRAGDPIRVQVFSTRKQSTAYVDVVKDAQTIVTRDLDIVNGRAELTISASPSMAGTLDLNAYVFGGDAHPVGDHRLVFVQPADELKIEASSDAPAYKPGTDAHIRFRVTNSRGEGVQAALGLQVVDEAVFALAEKRPGFAKVFFYLEQDTLKPRYEIHSLGMPDAVAPAEEAAAPRRDRAARALFAATEMVNGNRFETEFGRTVPQVKLAEYVGRYRTRMVTQVREAWVSAGGNTPANGDPRMRDAWGTALRVEDVNWSPEKMVHSAGPDKQFDTADDLVVFVTASNRKMVGHPSSGPSTLDANVEHGRGPFNGRAEIAGTVMDHSGGAIENATITAREIASGGKRTARSDGGGQFRFAALPPGTYDVRIATSDEAVSRRVAVQVRDLAVLSAVFRQGSTPAVLVSEFPNMRVRRDFMRAKAVGAIGGVPGGVVGGVIGGIVEMDRVQAAPMHALRAENAPRSMATGTAAFITVEPATAAPHIRSYFPEALYISPEIITDRNGAASISIPMADSITTWRMAMIASSLQGALGTGASSIRVFQDFFADLDLPVTLTQGDRVSIPVAIYNYSAARGLVRLTLPPEDWYSLVQDVPEKSVMVDAGRVGASQFTIEARRIGRFKLTLAANMGGGANADIIVREIEVLPNGREQNFVFNGRLETTVRHELNFPAASVPEAGKIFVRLYPGPLSQVIEGMDSILQMPGGCFEQTSSSTYPNVLALDYMKQTKKLTPEVHAKAESYIANGYQRLLTFEVPGGGFSWFGNAPANKILTAYGLMEFFDMSKVHEIDPNVISRTQQWLVGQQQADGSWKPDTSFINEGATNRYNADVLRITAYLAWSLGRTGYRGPGIEKARDYIEKHISAKADAYTLAVLANFAVDGGNSRDFVQESIRQLLDARTEKDDQAWWNAEETGVYSTGSAAAIETTGLAVQALLKWGEASATAAKALHYIAAKKDATGAWGTTQATIMALQALLLSTSKGAADVRGTVEVLLDGNPVQNLMLTPENNDLLHQFVFKPINAHSTNTVELRFTGKGGLAYQVTGRYFVPWADKPAGEPLSIDVAYDRTRMAQDDIATATATVRNNLRAAVKMVMIDLGIPPGFDLLSEDLQAYQEKTAGHPGGRLQKFSLTGTQAILYFDSIPAGEAIRIQYRLRAKYPIRARTFLSRVYEYYDPQVSSTARPVQLEVTHR
ncbi:MAG: MG2 domain-containing protein [Bryobacteraceae bacterium]